MYEVSPLEGLSGVRRGQGGLLKVPDPPRGRPVGGDGVHRNEEEGMS